MTEFNAKSVFVSSDKFFYIEELKAFLHKKNVSLFNKIYEKNLIG